MRVRVALVVEFHAARSSVVHFVLLQKITGAGFKQLLAAGHAQGKPSIVGDVGGFAAAGFMFRFGFFRRRRFRFFRFWGGTGRAPWKIARDAFDGVFAVLQRAYGAHPHVRGHGNGVRGRGGGGFFFFRRCLGVRCGWCHWCHWVVVAVDLGGRNMGTAAGTVGAVGAVGTLVVLVGHGVRCLTRRTN